MGACHRAGAPARIGRWARAPEPPGQNRPMGAHPRGPPARIGRWARATQHPRRNRPMGARHPASPPGRIGGWARATHPAPGPESADGRAPPSQPPRPESADGRAPPTQPPGQNRPIPGGGLGGARPSIDSGRRAGWVARAHRPILAGRAGWVARPSADCGRGVGLVARVHRPILARGLAGWRAPIGRFWPGGLAGWQRPSANSGRGGWLGGARPSADFGREASCMARAHQAILAGGLGGWRVTIGRFWAGC